MILNNLPNYFKRNCFANTFALIIVLLPTSFFFYFSHNNNNIFSLHLFTKNVILVTNFSINNYKYKGLKVFTEIIYNTFSIIKKFQMQRKVIY